MLLQGWLFYYKNYINDAGLLHPQSASTATQAMTVEVAASYKFHALTSTVYYGFILIAHF